MSTYSDATTYLTEELSFKKLIKLSIKELIPNSLGSITISIILLIFSLIISFFIGISPNTIEIANDIIKQLLSVQLAIFACVLTVYSILSAFFTDSCLKKLAQIETTENSKPFLVKCIEYFETSIVIYFIGVLISLIAMFLTSTMETSFRLFNCILDEIFAIILLSIYISINIRIVFELKSVIFNTFCIFRIYTSYRLIDFELKEHTENRS